MTTDQQRAISDLICKPYQLGRKSTTKIEIDIYLFDRGRPREGEAEKDDEEERAPQIPISECLTGVLAVRVREDNQLQIAHDSGKITLHSVPYGLCERVGGGSEPGDVGTRRRRRRRSGRGGFGERGRRREVGRNEGGRRGGDGDRDGGAWGTWRACGRD